MADAFGRMVLDYLRVTEVIEGEGATFFLVLDQ